MKAKIGVIGDVIGEICSIKSEGDSIVATVEVGGAVPWQIMIYLDQGDIRQIVRLALKPSIIRDVLFGLLRGRKSETSSEELDVD